MSQIILCNLILVFKSYLSFKIKSDNFSSSPKNDTCALHRELWIFFLALLLFLSCSHKSEYQKCIQWLCVNLCRGLNNQVSSLVNKSFYLKANITSMKTWCGFEIFTGRWHVCVYEHSWIEVVLAKHKGGFQHFAERLWAFMSLCSHNMLFLSLTHKLCEPLRSFFWYLTHWWLTVWSETQKLCKFWGFCYTTSRILKICGSIPEKKNKILIFER